MNSTNLGKPVVDGDDAAKADMEDMRDYMQQAYQGALEANAGAFSSAPGLAFADYMVARIAAFAKAREQEAERRGELYGLSRVIPNYDGVGSIGYQYEDGRAFGVDIRINQLGEQLSQTEEGKES